MKEVKEYFQMYASSNLHQGILAARQAGRRQDGKLISCRMAFELGATILLGLEANEEDIVAQDLEEMETQISLLIKKKQLKNDQLVLMKASKAVKMDEAAGKNGNIQKLAQRILEVWENVTLYKNYTIISSLVDIDKSRLSREKVEAIFPKKYTQKPTIETAIIMASNLLGYDSEGDMIGA